MNTGTTKKASHRKKCTAATVEQHVDPPLTPLIKSLHGDKLDKDCDKLTLRRDPTSDKSDIYEFKMDLFKNGNPEELLFFVCNSNMTHAAEVTLETATKAQ